ncbi:protein TIFY 10B-like [Impatiens glandulifera]|uniref:protein TIFY 10B-like n=1 Tax=Impatiens glandulifera TaxID=253017 RepID=UPI001FB0DB45|nr:protein TIFY 10B-like [Impatiens glandulifera]
MSSGNESSSFAGKSPEKSNFANTCNLLSNYLKYKGNLRDLSPNLAGQLAAKDLSATSSYRALDLFPQQAGEVNLSKIEEKNESKSAQMTIFYGGQVLVFNDIRAEKAMELMSFATTGVTNPTNNYSENKTMRVSGSSLVSDLPMTRTSSLYRFMERRKERVAARAPYKVNGRGSLKTWKSSEEDQLELSL